MAHNGSNTQTSSVTSTSYTSVLHKKQSGTLILNDSSLTFYYAGGGNGSSGNTENGNGNQQLDKIVVPWVKLLKHQVSPITHPKCFLKIILLPNGNGNGKGSHMTFQLTTRDELERIRKDVSTRLITARQVQAQNATSRKRSLDEVNQNATSSSSPGEQLKRQRGPLMLNRESSTNDIVFENEDGTSSNNSNGDNNNSTAFTTLNKLSSAVTRSSLLSSDPSLRMQHSLLVLGQPPPSDGTKNGGNGGGGVVSLGPIMDELNFWNTHQLELTTLHSQIQGITSRGLPSTMKSSLDITSTTKYKPIKIGVEEMRQIFILYPAVHKAYEAMVPLELSEEQFWRKYLESEFFHRDRGRMGTHFLNNATSNSKGKSGKEDDDEDGEDDGNGGENGDDGAAAAAKAAKEEETKVSKEQEENARVAAASSNDIFSRAALELQQAQQKQASATTTSYTSTGHNNVATSGGKCSTLGNKLAIGQFDLAATANTERGSKLLLHANDEEYNNNSSYGPNPNDPSSSTNNSNNTNPANSTALSKGSNVISKYNRHWAMVMNPDQATAGCPLMMLARQSANYALEGDEDAKAGGGVTKEMEQLVGFADAEEGRVDHVKCIGDPRKHHGGNDDGDSDENEDDSSLFQELQLQNIAAYSGGGSMSNSSAHDMQQQKKVTPIINDMKRYITPLLTQMQNQTKSSNSDANNANAASGMVHSSFPHPKLGYDLLVNLSKHMKGDSVTEKESLQMTNRLDENFRKKLTVYFRRSTELLRHFFALRQVMELEKRRRQCSKGSNKKKQTNGNNSTTTADKLAKIVTGMEGVYREMENMRNNLPKTEDGETMRKMSFPIMDQLNFAFSLQRQVSGGFVTVDD